MYIYIKINTCFKSTKMVLKLLSINLSKVFFFFSIFPKNYTINFNKISLSKWGAHEPHCSPEFGWPWQQWLLFFSFWFFKTKLSLTFQRLKVYIEVLDIQVQLQGQDHRVMVTYGISRNKEFMHKIWKPFLK
jgi:hypothetical protein